MVILLMTMALLGYGCRTASPQLAGGPAITTSILTAAREVMLASRYCALVTISEEGRAQARTMDPSSPDGDMVVTFVTKPSTRKVAEIARDPRVTLYYFDEASPGYVTILGLARAIGDVEEKQRRWLEKWTPHYPGGASSAAMYEVIPERIEVVSIAHGIVGDEMHWTPPAVDLQR